MTLRSLPFQRLARRVLLLAFAAPGLLAAQAPASTPPASPTIASIRVAGALTCGLVREEPEYSNLDAHGNRALFDVDLCKAAAVALLGPKARFNIVPYADENDAIEGLRAKAVDLLPTASVTLTNNAVRGLQFGPMILFDPQALMVNHAMGVHTAHDLAGKKVCYLTETNIELNLNTWMPSRHIAFLPFPFQEEGEMEAAFLTNNCAAITADATQLAYERIAFRSRGRDYEILPDVLATDPLASATRADDPAWTAIVSWVGNALLTAEQSGITAANAESLRTTTEDLAIRRLLGATPGIGKPLRLDDAWALRTIQAVGNYGEIFARDLGPTTPMRLERGPNCLWNAGGLLLPMPLR